MDTSNENINPRVRRHIPGVRFAGIIHPGLIGTAPSAELLEIWNKRERALVEDPPTTLARPPALAPQISRLG